MNVEFYRHHLGDAEKQALCNALDSVFLTAGPKTAEFEERFADFLGVKHVVGVASCTSALMLSLKALGIGSGHEVITTPMTFVASPNSVIEAGAVPVFVDVEEDTGNINADLIEKAITEKTRAIMPVHLYGHMCDMRRIKDIAGKHGLRIIEDCAHCVEGERDGVRPGQLGDAACFSFYATKNLTSGEGGAVATNSHEVSESLKKLRSHGVDKPAAERYSGTYQHWDMAQFGYKANMCDLQAALLIPQIEGIRARWEKRQTHCLGMERAIREIPGIRFPATTQGTKHARHLFTIWSESVPRDEAIFELNRRGIGCAVNYRAVHLLTYYKQTFGHLPKSFPAAERIGDTTLSLPLWVDMKEEMVNHIVFSLGEIFG